MHTMSRSGASRDAEPKHNSHELLRKNDEGEERTVGIHLLSSPSTASGKSPTSDMTRCVHIRTSLDGVYRFETRQSMS